MFNQYDDLLTVDELCEILKIGKNEAYRLLKDRTIKGFRIGRIWKISRESIESYIRGESM